MTTQVYLTSKFSKIDQCFFEFYIVKKSISYFLTAFRLTLNEVKP